MHKTKPYNLNNEYKSYCTKTCDICDTLNDVISLYKSEKGCIEISIQTGIPLSRVIKIVKMNITEGNPRM